MYREYGRLAYAVAYRVLGRDDLAEEAVQQTFVRAWQAADRIDVDRDPGAVAGDDREARRDRRLPPRGAGRRSHSPTSPRTTRRW